MTIAETIIRGFTVEIVPNEDREGVNCFITRDHACSSLAKAEDFGTIGEPDERGGEVKISDKALAEIREFAERYEY